MMRRIGSFLCLVFFWPALGLAQSTFSTPAGAPNSSTSFSTPSGAAINGPVISGSGFSVPAGAATNALVRAEVLRVDGDSYIVRDAQGRELRLQPAKDVRMEYLPRPGDWIEAQLSNGRTNSISKGSPSK